SGKPIESVRFKFAVYKSTDLCMTYDGYQGIGLQETTRRTPWCNVSEIEARPGDSSLNHQSGRITGYAEVIPVDLIAPLAYQRGSTISRDHHLIVRRLRRESQEPRAPRDARRRGGSCWWPRQ